MAAMPCHAMQCNAMQCNAMLDSGRWRQAEGSGLTPLSSVQRTCSIVVCYLGCPEWHSPGAPLAMACQHCLQRRDEAAELHLLV